VKYYFNVRKPAAICNDTSQRSVAT